MGTRPPSMSWRRVSGVSVGVLGYEGTLLGVINVDGLSQRLDEMSRHRAAEQTRAVARVLEGALQQQREAAV